MESVKLNVKGPAHKHCTLVDDLFFPTGVQVIYLKLLYMILESINNCMVVDGNRFITIEVGNLQIIRGKTLRLFMG